MVRIEFVNYTPKNRQQANKIRGTVFEHYVKRVLDRFFSRTGDVIIFQRKVSKLLEEAGLKRKRIYIIAVHGLLYPYPFEVKRGQTPTWFLRKIEVEKKGRLATILREANYEWLRIEKLSRFINRPDFVIVTRRGATILVDCKYRHRKYSIGWGDISRLLFYYSILRKLMEDVELGKPLLLFNVAKEEHISGILEGAKGKPMKGAKYVQSGFRDFFLENYVGELEANDSNYEDSENLFEADEYDFMLPSYLLSKEEVAEHMGKDFYVSFIEWFLKVLRLDPYDSVKIYVDNNKGIYTAVSDHFGQFYQGKIEVSEDTELLV